MSLSGEISTIAGIGTPGYSGNNGPATAAQLNHPQGVAVDGLGNVYFTEYENNCIRKIDLSGTISTIAGGTYGYYGDGGPATASKLKGPIGICINAAGDIYFTDGFNHCIREISSSGIINTIAGTGVSGFSGDGFPATTANLKTPTDVTIDASGNLYIADWGNDRIRTLKLSTAIQSVSTAHAGLSLYPNPNMGKFNVKMTPGINDRTEIVILDIAGAKVKEFSVSVKDPVTIELDVPSGVYILSAITKGVVSTEKLTIIR